jgi:hypothetical protein
MLFVNVLWIAIKQQVDLKHIQQQLMYERRFFK